mmetsp:Transcript_8682/g.7978  ORF Transcript_8682/g.7978 Transcript_8682/m.7978 type:complete len:81 (+) Transcript_8682:259-501(+)
MASCLVNSEYQTYPKFAIFGGYLEDSIFTNDLYLYDLVNQKWEYPYTYALTPDSMPSPRQGSSMVYSKGKLWIFGGYSHA